MPLKATVNWETFSNINLLAIRKSNQWWCFFPMDLLMELSKNLWKLFEISLFVNREF